MTNLWLGIGVSELCDQHLLGLHNEIHKETGAIENHPHGEAILKGHYRLGQVDSTAFKRRHDEVADEMERRGMNHDSFLDYTDEKGLIVAAFPIEKFNRVALAARCDDCL